MNKIIKKENIVWSEYQKKIFEDVATQTGNVVVNAYAGSAKTTSIVEALKYIPKNKKSILVAFNKSIADELRLKAPTGVDCSTLHSVGFRAIRQKFGNVVVDNTKVYSIIESIIGKDNFDLSSEIAKAVSLCKATISDTPDKVSNILDKYGIDFFPEDKNEFISYVLRAMRMCKEQTSIIDFDDMIYFAVAYNLNLGKYDYVFVDEAQDLNLAQVMLALSLAHSKSRIFVCLDRFQAIYSWRGSDIDSVNKLIESLNGRELKLPISYRCPKSVINLAKQYVSDIECPITAKEGSVQDINTKIFLDKVKPGDFVISRTNAPLIKYCMILLKQGIPANIAGKDIGSNFQAFIKKSKAKSIDKFIDYVNKWKDLEIKRLAKDKKDISLATDKAECLISLCEGLSSVRELKDLIDKLFSDDDDKKKVILLTVHKAKGLERDRVFILAWSFFNKDANQEEKNISYVAITRAKSELFFVNKTKEAKNKKDKEVDNEQLDDDERRL